MAVTKGVLPLDQLKINVENNTGFFETSSTDPLVQMGTTSGNHDSAGMSGGNLQINFGAANHLTELWQYMINNYEQKCIDAFGTNTTEYNTWKTAMLSTVQSDRVNFGDSISTPTTQGDPNYKRFIIEPYKSAFTTLLQYPESIAKYYALRDQYYWDLPYNLFQSMSCTSRMALASLFDCYINMGRLYPVNLLTADFEKIDADPSLDATAKEKQKIYQINERCNSEECARSDASSVNFAPRRDAMANMTGDYYGLAYDPVNQFDISLEPASAEKVAGTGVNLGSLAVNNVYLGSTPVTSIYLGATLLGGSATPYTNSIVPSTQIRTNGGSWQGIGSATSITVNQGAPIYIDCNPASQGMVACKTYYTKDGTEPTENSTLYDAPITFDSSCTFKCKTISVYGVAEATKTITVNVAVPPVTTIAPTATVQNTIPFNVTLTSSESGAAIKYQLGNATSLGSTVYSYTAPFSVNQNSTGVASTQIKVVYWSVGASATEASKTIVYDTSGAVPGTPVVTATPGAGSVTLSWAATANTTSYTVVRSTTAGTSNSGTVISQYQAETSYTDSGLTAGTTYYYTVRAGNYQTNKPSAEVSVTPTAASTKPSYRYIKVHGYGEYYSAAAYTNTRMIELEVFSGGVNKLSGKTGTSAAVSTGAEVGSTTPTKVTDGVKGITSNTYNIWWEDVTLNNNAGNGFVTFDLGAQVTIDSIRYWGYTSRAPRFKIYASNTAADLPGGSATVGAGAVLLWDLSGNTGTAGTNIDMAGATAGTNNYVEKVFS